MRASPFLMILLLGCTDPVPDSGGSDNNDTEAASCPSGYSEASAATAGFTNFRLDGLYVTVELDTDVTVDGQAAACVNEAGTNAILSVTAADEPYATLTFASEETGTFVVGEFTGTMTLNVTGGDSPATFSTVDFTFGTFSVVQVGSTFEYGFTGEGNVGGRPLGLTFAAVVSP